MRVTQHTVRLGTGREQPFPLSVYTQSHLQRCFGHLTRRNICDDHDQHFDRPINTTHGAERERGPKHRGIAAPVALLKRQGREFTVAQECTVLVVAKIVSCTRLQHGENAV